MTIRLQTADGVSQALRWTNRHPRSLPGRGVLLYRHSGVVLEGLPPGAIIAVTMPREAQRVARALALSDETAKTCIKVEMSHAGNS